MNHILVDSNEKKSKRKRKKKQSICFGKRYDKAFTRLIVAVCCGNRYFISTASFDGKCEKLRKNHLNLMRILNHLKISFTFGVFQSLMIFFLTNIFSAYFFIPFCFVIIFFLYIPSVLSTHLDHLLHFSTAQSLNTYTTIALATIFYSSFVWIFELFVVFLLLFSRTPQSRGNKVVNNSIHTLLINFFFVYSKDAYCI